MKKIIFTSIITLVASIIFYSCFPTYKATKVDLDTLNYGKYVKTQAKLFTTHNTILLFPNGFEINDNLIWGNGIVNNFASANQIRKNVEVPIDSITAMITYEETTSGSRYFGSFLYGLTAPPLTFLGLYCLACPKCCFGSCPTIYTFDGQNYNLEVELFSECISRQLENNDLDLLKQKIINDTLKLNITNEALETHYINKLDLLVADHPIGTKLLLTIENNLTLFSNFILPTNAISKDKTEISKLVSKDDNQYYRSGVEKISELKKGPTFDYIEIPAPPKATKMLVKYRNTLLSTTLLYDVVVGSQGVDGLEWTDRMNNDPTYASQFKLVYEAFSGIKIKTFTDGSWNAVGLLKDAGPLNWKYNAVELPITNSNDYLIRLEFIPDNFMIDYIAFDTTYTNTNEIITNIIPPVLITNSENKLDNEPFEFIKNDDDNYLRTYPGDSYSFQYYIPNRNDCEQTVLIKSKGYYNEWVRGEWIKNKPDSYTFDLYDIKGTLSYLADSWLENSSLLENEFFNSRIILKEAK